MTFYDRIERELLADEPSEAKQLDRDLEVQDIWEIATPSQTLRDSRKLVSPVWYWRYRSLSKSRYLRHFAR